MWCGDLLTADRLELLPELHQFGEVVVSALLTFAGCVRSEQYMHSIYGVAKWSQAYESTYWHSNDTYTMFTLFRSNTTPFIYSRLTFLISYELTSHVRTRELWMACKNHC